MVVTIVVLTIIMATIDLTIITIITIQDTVEERLTTIPMQEEMLMLEVFLQHREEIRTIQDLRLLQLEEEIQQR